MTIRPIHSSSDASRYHPLSDFSSRHTPRQAVVCRMQRTNSMMKRSCWYTPCISKQQRVLAKKPSPGAGMWLKQPSGRAGISWAICRRWRPCVCTSGLSTKSRYSNKSGPAPSLARNGTIVAPTAWHSIIYGVGCMASETNTE